MFRSLLPAVLVSVAGVCAGPIAFGLAEERIGPDLMAHPQPDWAHGLVELPRHGSRVYSLWVNGNDTFYFNAKPDDVTDLITKFSKVRLRDHVVRLVPGDPTVASFKKQEFAYNVSLNVLGGIALWHTKTTDPQPQTYEPVLTVYVAGEQQQKALQEYAWPESIVIQNDVADWDLSSQAKQPFRKLLHAVIQFDDGKPAVDFESGMSTTVTLWEKDQEHGFDLGTVGNEGQFTAAFSLDELAALKKGDLWLTMTVGNYTVKPKPADPRLDVDSFAFTPDGAKPVSVARSTTYYGRLLFEDGSPPVLNPLPWPGAEIQVDFPYAGPARPDADGYFRIALTAEQFENLKARKPRKNIYIPLYTEANHSRALHTFPAENLSPDAEKLTAVRIPRPKPDSSE
ncbi:MAG: hypothetical protein R3C19_13590 [Planctomycetaceae bacterium]